MKDEEEILECADCGTILNGGDPSHENGDGDRVCEDCAGNYAACADCGEIVSCESEYHDENGDPICESCAEHYFTCTDGAGYMFPCEGRLLISKGFFTFPDFLDAWEKTQKLHGDGPPVVFHFRIATAGWIDTTNCHPHRIASDLGFVHNGILSRIAVPKHGKQSDTILYRNRYLAKLTGRSLHNGKLVNAISRHIGAGNKFAFMNGSGEVVICNEEEGVWKDGLWFSNHSFLSRPAFPFSFQDDEWSCGHCGHVLATPEELADGVCQECREYFELERAECGGCYGLLFSNAHKAAGWCDDCGFEIYGRDWPNWLREAGTRAEECLSDWF